MLITWETIITAGKVLGALTAIGALLFSIVRFIDRQKVLEKELVELRDIHCSDMSNLNEEQRLLMYGVLACLKGLKEQGCNGPVTEAIDTLEKYINKKAHE